VSSSVRLALVSVSLFLLLFPLALGKPGLPTHLKADEIYQHFRKYFYGASATHPVTEILEELHRFGGYYAYVSSKFSNDLIVVDPDPNNDGNPIDAKIVGRVLLTLWKEHLAADQRDRDQRAEARADADAYRELLREAHSIHRDQVNAWNKRNEQDAARQRRSDRQ